MGSKPNLCGLMLAVSPGPTALCFQLPETLTWTDGRIDRWAAGEASSPR